MNATAEVVNNTPTHLSFVSQSLHAALTVDNVHSEVDQLLEEARNSIGRFEATDEWLADNLNDLPQIVEGDVTVMFMDTRKFNQIKKQSLSEALWVVAIKQLQYHIAVNYDLIATAAANWISNNVYREIEDMGKTHYEKVEVTTDSMLYIAKDYLAAMQSLNIIGKNLTKKVVRLKAGNKITAKVYEMTPEFTEELNELIKILRAKVSYKCKPLMHQPVDWSDASTGIAETAGMKLVTRSKVKSNKVHVHVLSAVNKLQRVQFTVSTTMLEAAKDMVINKALYKQPTFSEQFSDKELNQEAFDIYGELQQYKGKKFYFPVTMDTRGRMYYRGGLMTPQGVDFCKASFQFAESKKLGKSGFNAVCMHVANVCGQDKESIVNRIQWVKNNWETIMSVNTHMDVRQHFKGASVFQALVACRELRRLSTLIGAWKDKESNLVCHMDGTCNGLQHMAAITGDRATAEAVNCVASTYEDKPADVYGLVAKQAEQHAIDTALEMILKYARDMAKDPVMVTSYGATETTVKANIEKYLVAEKESVTDADSIGDAYLLAISETAGAVTQLTEALSTRVNYAIAEGHKKFSWVTADGFMAATKYENDEAMVVRVGLFHVRKRGMGAAPLDTRKTAQAMAPNFIHSIDATHLRMVINQCDHELVAVHDSIGSHPCDYFDTADKVRQMFVLVHNGYSAIDDLCASMGQPVPKFAREGDYNAKEAIKSAYIFS